MGQKSKPLPDLATLQDLFYLNKGTGVLYWKHHPNRPSRWNTRWANKAAGTVVADGYLVVRINGDAFYNHRLIFKMYNGYDPVEIDHDDGNRLRNVKSNLVDTSSSGNGKNKALLATNTSGHHGVSYNKKYKKWEAYITSNRVREQLGYFKDMNDAIAARRAAEARLGFSPKHGTR